ncbi:hypothetical protein [Streptomyces sp. TE33382]
MIVAILIPSVRPCDPPRQREQQVIRHRIGKVGERRDAGHGGEVSIVTWTRSKAADRGTNELSLGDLKAMMQS